MAGRRACMRDMLAGGAWRNANDLGQFLCVWLWRASETAHVTPPLEHNDPHRPLPSQRRQAGRQAQAGRPLLAAGYPPHRSRVSQKVSRAQQARSHTLWSGSDIKGNNSGSTCGAYSSTCLLYNSGHAPRGTRAQQTCTHAQRTQAQRTQAEAADRPPHTHHHHLSSAARHVCACEPPHISLANTRCQ